MADIHLSRNLINQLVEDEVRPKKKTKKTKPKIPRERQGPEKKVHQKPIPNESETQKERPAARWPPQMPFFLPTPTPSPSSSPELEAIRSLLKESESVLEKLQRLEENMSKEVTQQAKELHEKEFNLPQQKTIICQPEMNACLQCYKEHVKDPLKCASLVSSFQECVRKARKQVNVPG